MIGLISVDPIRTMHFGVDDLKAIPPFVAQGACSSCPYRARCHEARQLVMDPRGLGRHTSCDFYREFERRLPGRRSLAGRVLEGVRSWLR